MNVMDASRNKKTLLSNFKSREFNNYVFSQYCCVVMQYVASNSVVSVNGTENVEALLICRAALSIWWYLIGAVSMIMLKFFSKLT